jgi:hypothetical protein
MFLAVILGPSWHLQWLTAILWLCTSARIFISFNQPTFWPSSVLSTRPPPAIITWGLAFLALGDTLAPWAIAQPPLAIAVVPLAGDQQFITQTAPLTSVNGEILSVGSHPLLSSKSLSRGGNPPPAEVIPSPSASVWTSISSRISSVVVKPPPWIIAHSVPQDRVPRVPPAYGPPCPDPDGLAKPPSAMGGCQFPGYICSSPIYGGPHTFMGGLPHTNVTSSAFHLLVQWWITVSGGG